jgi:uncharacterized 2Fe-2S/4Fe-4S cluster protein (DUF4445 family)
MAKPPQLEIESTSGRLTIVPAPHQTVHRLTELLRREHLPLNTRCGQRGLCDGCTVELLEGQLIHLTTGEPAAPGLILGCEYRLGSGNARIRIPARSQLAYEPQVVSEFRVNIPRAHNPLATPLNHGRTLGAAIDIGTTTVALILVDLRDGQIVGSAADFNKQMHLGDDVATRIGLCASDPKMLEQLRDAVLNQTILPLLKAANPAGDPVACLSVAGNTTMLHLLAGIDPSPMGVYPFQPAFLEHRIIDPESTHLLPSASAYIGADLVAGVLATGLAYDDGPSLLVDVGTNGEIILKYNHHLLGCATAAGPAFEGAGLTNGIRAGDGAIERIQIAKETFAVKTEVIGGVAPFGICGSAYVDFLAEGRRSGLLNANGRFTVPLVDAGDGGRALPVAKAQGNQPVLVSELDVARLLQAKAAVAAGILTLLDRVHLKPSDIKRLYLAGGFGMHLDVPNAIACGLLPGFVPEQVQVVGNTSLAGAYLALLDRGALDEMAHISRQLEVVELNLDPHFEPHYIDQLSLP